MLSIVFINNTHIINIYLTIEEFIAYFGVCLYFYNVVIYYPRRISLENGGTVTGGESALAVGIDL
jgi:hypothetical protein